MPDQLTEIQGVPTLLCAADGQRLRTERDATDLIGAAFGGGAQVVVVPVERLAGEFFRLRTGLAGAFVQKFVNYRMRLVVLGDVSGPTAGSEALSAFVRESNRGGQLWFLADLAELDARLRPAG